MVFKTRRTPLARLFFEGDSHGSNMVYHRQFFRIRARAG
jgi:hypothetical protein